MRLTLGALLLAAVANAQPAADSSSSPLGTNLTLVNPSSTEWAFVDAFKMSSPWTPECAPAQYPDDDCTASGDTGETGLLDLDADGWVRSLPAPADPPVFWVVSTLMFRNQGAYPLLP